MLRIGAFLLGSAGLLWAVVSAQYGDTRELLWCGTVGAGFVLFGVGLNLGGTRGRTAAAAGLVVAGAGGTYWILQLAAADPVGVWVLFGYGLVLAALGGIAFWALPGWRAQVAWAFPVAFAVVAASCIRMLATTGFAADLNTLATVAALAGAVLLALRGAGAYLDELDDDVPARALAA